MGPWWFCRYVNLLAIGGHDSGMTPFNLTRREPNHAILTTIACCEDPSTGNMKLVEPVLHFSLSYFLFSFYLVFWHTKALGVDLKSSSKMDYQGLSGRKLANGGGRKLTNGGKLANGSGRKLANGNGRKLTNMSGRAWD
jgi:hypothetical protein